MSRIAVLLSEHISILGSGYAFLNEQNNDCVFRSYEADLHASVDFQLVIVRLMRLNQDLKQRVSYSGIIGIG